MLEGTQPLQNSQQNVIKCAVTSCTNDSNTEIGGRKLLLYTPPSSPRLKRFWVDAVPTLFDQDHKVCEAHFLSQSSKIGMYPSLNLATRKRKHELGNVNYPVITVRKHITVSNTSSGPVVSTTTTPAQDSLTPTGLPRKVIRVIHKANVIEPGGDSRPLQAATATVTVARPINLLDIMGDKSAMASTSTPCNKSVESNVNKTIDVYPAVASTSFAPQNSTFARGDMESEECSGDHEDLGRDPSCSKCTSQLPAIRKSLVRLESRLDTMLTMARTLLSRAQTLPHHYPQRPVFTMGSDSRVHSQNVDNIPTVSNVKIVKKFPDLPPSYPPKLQQQQPASSTARILGRTRIVRTGVSTEFGIAAGLASLRGRATGTLPKRGRPSVRLRADIV